MPATPEYPTINKVLSRMIWDAVQGHQSVADTLRGATEECAAILADYARRRIRSQL